MYSVVAMLLGTRLNFKILLALMGVFASWVCLFTNMSLFSTLVWTAPALCSTYLVLGRANFYFYLNLTTAQVIGQPNLTWWLYYQ